jgi:hypothetical protein
MAERSRDSRTVKREQGGEEERRIATVGASLP